jgi:hypothetical protein
VSRAETNGARQIKPRISRYPAGLPTVEEIIAVMRAAGDAVRLRALIVGGDLLQRLILGVDHAGVPWLR